MRGGQLLTATMALCCVLALGMASTGLGGSVDSDPDDVIDLDYSSFPIGSDRAEEIKRKVQGEATSGDASRETRTRATVQASDPDGTGEQVAGTTQAEAEESRPGDQRTTQGQMDAGGRDQRSGAPGGGPTAPPPSLLDRLLALLSRILPWLLLAAVAALLYRYRDRIAGWLERGDAPGAAADGGDRGPFDPSPSNEVARAWYEMLDRLGVELDRTKTPREYARDAVEAGGDPDAVQRVTRPFEEVRYGGAPADDARTRRANSGLEALRDGGVERTDGGRDHREDAE